MIDKIFRIIFFLVCLVISIMVCIEQFLRCVWFESGKVWGDKHGTQKEG